VTHLLGLIGGVSWGATGEYYRRINLGINRRLGAHHSAEMLIRSFDLEPLLQRAEDIAFVETVFAQAGRGLCEAGATVLGIASLTGHRYAARLRLLPARFIDIVDAVGSRVSSDGYTRVAVWATSFLLGDTALLQRLAAACAVRLIVPRPELRTELDRIVFAELANQVIAPESVAWLEQLAAQHAAEGAEALLLGSTDFTPLASVLRTSLPILDASEMHCEALVEAACARPLPRPSPPSSS
jgi:aspartate racemase